MRFLEFLYYYYIFRLFIFLYFYFLGRKGGHRNSLEEALISLSVLKDNSQIIVVAWKESCGCKGEFNNLQHNMGWDHVPKKGWPPPGLQKRWLGQSTSIQREHLITCNDFPLTLKRFPTCWTSPSQHSNFGTEETEQSSHLPHSEIHNTRHTVPSNIFVHEEIITAVQPF